MRSLPSGARVPTTAGRWEKGSSSATRCAVPGITPVSACGPVSRSARRLSVRSPRGAWSAMASGLPSARKTSLSGRGKRVADRRPSSSSVAAPPGTLPRRRCGARGTTARSPWSRPTPPLLTTGRICRRTISPALRRRSGFLCTRPSFMPKTGSTSDSERGSRRSTRMPSA